MRLTTLAHMKNLATKTFVRDPQTGEIEKAPWGGGRNFTISTREFTGIGGLYEVLQDLAPKSKTLTVRGVPVDGLDMSRPQPRLSNPKPKQPATIKDAPMGWFMVDMDGIPEPPLCDLVNDPESAAEYLRDQLPPEFQDVAGVVQFSSSQSVPGIGKDGTLSAHLWFILPRPLTCVELKRWATWFNQKDGPGRVDSSVFQAVQAHYTAAPIFSGLSDPLPRRLIKVDGLFDVVDIELPPPEWDATKRARPQTGSQTDATDHLGGSGFDFHLSTAGSEQRGIRTPIRSAIGAAVRESFPNIDAEQLKSLVRDGIGAMEFPVLSDGTQRGKDEAEAYVTDTQLDGMIQLAVDAETVKAEAVAEAASTPVEPTYPDKTIPVDEARRLNDESVAKFFEAEARAFRGKQKTYQSQLVARDAKIAERDERIKAGAQDFAPDPPMPIRPSAPIVAINATAGLGKTQAYSKHLAKDFFTAQLAGEWARYAVFIPRHTLGDQSQETLNTWAREFKDEGKELTSEVYRSRHAVDPESSDERLMCLDIDRVREIESAFGNVARMGCNDHRGNVCPYFFDCGYQRQQERIRHVRVVFMAHQMMFFPPPDEEMKIGGKRPIRAAIIDEGFEGAGLHDFSDPQQWLTVDEITYPRIVQRWKPQKGKSGGHPIDDPGTTADLLALAGKLAKVLREHPDGYIIRDKFLNAGIKVEHCREAMGWEEKCYRYRYPKIDPSMSIDQVKKAATPAKGDAAPRAMFDVWRLLGDFLESDERECVYIKVQKNQPLPGSGKSANVIKMGWRASVNSAYQVPTLYLDATMS